ncbi:MAG: DUF4345 domain-containing protein [Myxococcota bacterium]
MSLAGLVLRLSALAYGGIGVAFLAAPAEMAAAVDVSVGSASADNDVRAVYGGLDFGLAIFCLASASRPDWHRPALWVVTLTLGAMSLARVLSWMLAGFPDPIALALHAAETLGCGLAAFSLTRLPRPSAGMMSSTADS